MSHQAWPKWAAACRPDRHHLKLARAGPYAPTGGGTALEIPCHQDGWSRTFFESKTSAYRAQKQQQLSGLRDKLVRSRLEADDPPLAPPLTDEEQCLLMTLAEAEEVWLEEDRREQEPERFFKAGQEVWAAAAGSPDLD